MSCEEPEHAPTVAKGSALVSPHESGDGEEMSHAQLLMNKLMERCGNELPAICLSERERTPKKDNKAHKSRATSAPPQNLAGRRQSEEGKSRLEILARKMQENTEICDESLENSPGPNESLSPTSSAAITKTVNDRHIHVQGAIKSVRSPLVPAVGSAVNQRSAADAESSGLLAVPFTPGSAGVSPRIISRGPNCKSQPSRVPPKAVQSQILRSPSEDFPTYKGGKAPVKSADHRPPSQQRAAFPEYQHASNGEDGQNSENASRFSPSSSRRCSAQLPSGPTPFSPSAAGTNSGHRGSVSLFPQFPTPQANGPSTQQAQPPVYGVASYVQVRPHGNPASNGQHGAAQVGRSTSAPVGHFPPQKVPPQSQFGPSRVGVLSRSPNNNPPYSTSTRS
eukprot:NODE_942_length_1804_cov_41.120228_g829_i0.p1 GENE.NODE_942_length_1804_cov_41.120228_g829_i0~~NODE_942_length_1804_cov_41.120228_g829_i0.p1  ORF type:complete len:394 (+),score=32.85 NODE_942_length_1804_cov_41.120228_g829_i0:77-1258(+)